MILVVGEKGICDAENRDEIKYEEGQSGSGQDVMSGDVVTVTSSPLRDRGRTT